MNENPSNSYEETFYIIPRCIRKLPGITLAYLDIYETIFQFWNKNKHCFLSEKSLCFRTGYQRAILYRALAFFESHNELKRVKKNGKQYLIKPEKIIETDCSENIPMSTTVDSDVYNRRLSTSTTVDHNIKKLNKETNNSIVDFEKSTTKKTDFSKTKNYKDDVRFMRFYNAYPRHEDPRDAYKAFLSVVGHDDEVLDAILLDIEERKKRHTQWKDKQYIKMPATYLRKGEYLGEIFDAITESREKEEQKKIENEKRVTELEERSKNRAEEERLNNLAKQGDAFIYRDIQKKVYAQPQKRPQGLDFLIRQMGIE